jgi:CelD/BcsL family acetyltransferase involved in cellulose biosynthesis
MASSFWTERPVPLWLNPPPETDARERREPSGATAGRRLPSFTEARFFIETFGFETAAELSEAWLDLISRALEPNVFMEPGFALSAAQHLARADRPTFVGAWESDGGEPRGRLVALWALVIPTSVIGSHVATLWCHTQSALGAPLLDAKCAEQVLAALFTWLAEAFPRLRVLVFPKLVRSGATFPRLLAHALESGLEWRLLNQYERAALFADGSALNLSKPHGEQLRRQRRQLERSGTVSLRSARKPGEIRDATEAFLALEESGWKGARRTALLSDISRAAFARTMTRRLAHENKCRIDALMLDERPIAMGIVLRSRDRAFFWKIAYDEAFAAQSPGVQLALEVTRLQQSENACRVTDSCTMPGNKMIERLWAERLPIVDLALPIDLAANEMLAGYAWRNVFMRRVRQWAGKRLRRARRKVAS